LQMSTKLICFTLFLLFTASFCQNQYVDFVYEVSPFMKAQKAPSDLNPNLVEFVEGFLVGVGSATNFDDLKACLVDSEEIYADLDTGVSDILTKKIAEVKKGIALLGQAAQVVPTAAQACKAGDADLARLIQAVESFKNPAAFFYYVGKSLLINHVEVIHEIEGVVDADQAHNYTGLGYWIGAAMDTILLNQKIFDAPQDNKTDLIEFARGFLIGISNASIFDNLKACIADSEEIYTDIDNGVADIRTRNPDEVKQGIALLGQAAQIVPNAAQLCQVSEVDMDKLFQLIESFKSPQSFIYYVGKSLLINHVEVKKEVEGAVNAYIAKNYTDLGFWVGKAMDTILLNEKIAVRDNKADLLNFTLGFLEGVGSASAFDDIKACIADGDQWANDVDQGIADIKTRKPEEVKKGIHLLGEAAQVVPNAVQLCRASDVDLDTLLKEVESFRNPVDFLYYVGKSLMINHVEVLDEVDNALTGYEAKNYTDLGYWVGKTMDTIMFNGSNQTVSEQEIRRFRFNLLW